MKNAMHSVVSNYGRTYELHSLNQKHAETGFPIQQKAVDANGFLVQKITPLQYSSEEIDRLGVNAHAKISTNLNILNSEQFGPDYAGALIKEAPQVSTSAWIPAPINNFNFDMLGNKNNLPLANIVGNVNHTAGVNLNGVKLSKTRRY
jgi:hypothetical protein